MINKSKRTIPFLILLGSIFILTACESNFKKIHQYNTTTFFPIGTIDTMYGQYIDSGKVKAILISPKMLDYTNVKNQFNEFPEGIEVIFFDKDNNKNTVVADYAIRYALTGLIDLQGNVVITMHDGKKLESDQLYFDQKNDWLFTEGKYKASENKDNFIQGTGIDFDSKLLTIKTRNSYVENLKKDK